MAGIQLIDNFSYKGPKFLDNRQQCDTLEQMRLIDETMVPDGFLMYCSETKLWYGFRMNAPELPDTGRWRVFGGGGGQSESPVDAESITATEIDDLFNSIVENS